MNTEQFFDVIPHSVITECLDIYNDSNRFNDPNPKLMGKSTEEDAYNASHNIKPIIEKLLGKEIVFCTGNFYKHNTPYYPHTDYKKHLNNYINTVIPLEYVGDLPNLVVFDQLWNFESVTWCLNAPVMKFIINTGVHGSPCQYPVEGLTNKPIDDIFYNNYLSHLKKDTLYGLSGQAYPFKPKSIILFDGRKIHCTARLQNYKTGLSLRFKYI